MKYGNATKGVRATSGYRLRIVFQDGYIGEVDLWPLFEKPRGPFTEPFQDPAFFAKVFVDIDALQSVRMIDFRGDSLPRISQISRMGNPLLLIRAIREIRGCTSLVASLRLCVFALNVFRFPSALLETFLTQGAKTQARKGQVYQIWTRLFCLDNL
jgi:hypothetical protein